MTLGDSNIMPPTVRSRDLKCCGAPAAAAAARGAAACPLVVLRVLCGATQSSRAMVTVHSALMIEVTK